MLLESKEKIIMFLQEKKKKERNAVDLYKPMKKIFLPKLCW